MTTLDDFEAALFATVSSGFGVSLPPELVELKRRGRAIAKREAKQFRLTQPTTKTVSPAMKPARPNSDVMRSNANSRA